MTNERFPASTREKICLDELSAIEKKICVYFFTTADKSRFENFLLECVLTYFELCRHELLVVRELAEVNFVQVGRVAAGDVPNESAASVKHFAADITFVALVL